MTIAAGSRLGPYEILAPIGAGGMGEVYRAKDPRLGRDVAIKVLPASFSADPDRLRRFEQEARAAGILNHPNITAVYDIGSNASDGAPYVVSELLEGETLRSALAGGRLSPRRATDYALQIAHGLAAAHEKGIVHRDLKPENLFVTKDGRVKILDFGLAKLTHTEEGSQATNLPTATAGTEPGVVLGTLGYMAPEQVRGKPADARSDLFSFGAILYEMLAGKRAFHGDSAADTMSAILREDPPDLSATNQAVSPGLERIVRHCLEKSPEQRFHSAHDVAFALEALTGISQPSAAGAVGVLGRRAPRVALPRLAAIAAAAVLLGVAAGHFLWRPAKLAAPTYRRITFRRGNIGTARFAPDGRSVVYGASFEGQPIEIFTTRPEGPESTPIGSRSADLYAVSPSGELAISLRERFQAGPAGPGTLATMPLGGGAPRQIAEFVERADWTPGGKDLAVVRFSDGKDRVELPPGKPIYASERSIRMLRMSPKGDLLAILQAAAGASNMILVIDLAGKPRVLVDGGIQGQGFAWSPSSDEVLFDDRGERGQFLIKAVDMAGRVRTLTSSPVGMIVHDVSKDGRILVERYESQPGIFGIPPGGTAEREFSWFDGSRLVGLSDDGRTILINERGDAAGRDGAHYLRGTDGSPAVKLGEGSALALSPDGKWVLARAPGSESNLVLQPTGTGPPVAIDEPLFQRVGAFALFPDSRRILLMAAEPGKTSRLYVQDLPSGKPRAITDQPYGLAPTSVSPDGLRAVAYKAWTEDIYLVPTAGGAPRTIPNSKALDLIRWAPDGKSLYVTPSGSIPAEVVRIDVETGRHEPLRSLAPPERSGLIEIFPVFMAADAKSYFYGIARAGTSDLYLIDGLR
ncbi:MAG TPA: protein kinase [Thermoanaerobaculia bacterium]|nr:protein kinase [Thermoanaerobaculia bacterium]